MIARAFLLNVARFFVPNEKRRALASNAIPNNCSLYHLVLRCLKKIFAASLRYGDKSCSSFSSVCCFWLPRTRTILRFITPIQNLRCAGRFAAAANPNNLSAYIPANSSLNDESRSRTICRVTVQTK